MTRAERNRRRVRARAVEKALLRPEPAEMRSYLMGQGWTRAWLRKSASAAAQWEVFLPPGKGGLVSGGKAFKKHALELGAAWDVRDRYRKI